MVTATASMGARLATPVLGVLAVGLLLGATQSPPPDLQSGLIAYWKLDETSGNSAADSAGSNTGTTTGGPAITTSDLSTTIKFSNAACLTFDGVDDFVSAGTNPALDPASMTVAFWTRNLVAPAQWDGLLGKTNTDLWTQGWGFFYQSPSEIRFFVGDYFYGAASAPITSSQWNHVVGTRDGSTIQIYVNGVAGTSATWTAGYGGSDPLEIGRLGDDLYNINGSIDDVRVYNRVLTSQEIAALAQGYSGPPTAPSGVQATPGDGEVTLLWSAAPQAESYTVRRSTTSGSGYVDVATGVMVLGYVDQPVPSGTYYYVVAAVNPVGSSANSVEVPVTITKAPSGGAGGSSHSHKRCGVGMASVPDPGVLAALLLASLLVFGRRPK